MADMPPLRRIVVGVDGTANSAAAVRWAVREAELRHSIVQLVCASDDDPRLRAPYAPPIPASEQAERNADAQAQLSLAVALARRHLPPHRVIIEMADEPAAQALLSRASGAEMLVLGTSPIVHPSGERTSMGPVGRTCVSKAPCPVVVVPPAISAAVPDRNAHDAHGHRTVRPHLSAVGSSRKPKVAAVRDLPD